MGKKASKPPDTKQNLLRISAKLFAAKGYDSVSVRDIAKKAKVNVALISYHFGSKEALYQEIFLSHMNDHKETILSYVGQATQEKLTKAKFKSIIETLIRQNLDRSREFPEIALLFQRERLENLPYARQAYEDAIGPISEVLVALIKDAQKAGIVRTDLHPKLFFSSLFESMWGYTVVSRCGLKALEDCYVLPRDQVKYIDFLTKLFIEGSLAR